MSKQLLRVGIQTN